MREGDSQGKEFQAEHAEETIKRVKEHHKD